MENQMSVKKRRISFSFFSFSSFGQSLRAMFGRGGHKNNDIK